jgi:hypothetical protein
METAMKILVATEQVALDTLFAFRKAIRQGDLARAERWLRCAERHYQLSLHARRDAEEWKARRREQLAERAERARRIEENRRYARQLRAAEHRKRLQAIEDGARPQVAREITDSPQ